MEKWKMEVKNGKMEVRLEGECGFQKTNLKWK